MVGLTHVHVYVLPQDIIANGILDAKVWVATQISLGPGCKGLGCNPDFAGSWMLRLGLQPRFRWVTVTMTRWMQPGVGANAFAHASGIHADGVLKDPQNYELYDFKELGRGEPEIVETGREIASGEYSGISGFRHIMGKIEMHFENSDEAEEILELVRYANVLAQKPLVADELRFIAKYPDIVRDLLALTPLAPFS